MHTFQSNISNIYGEKGKAWLDELPGLVTAIKIGLGHWIGIGRFLMNICKIPDEYLQKARKLRGELLQTSEADVLLHGDLHMIIFCKMVMTGW